MPRKTDLSPPGDQMTFSDQKLLDEKLSKFFQGELPRPFPPAPLVFSKATNLRKSHSMGSRLALAACLLILGCLAFFWPRQTEENNPDNPLRARSASASDDKRHQVPFLNPREAAKTILPPPGK